MDYVIFQNFAICSVSYKYYYQILLDLLIALLNNFMSNHLNLPLLRYLLCTVDLTLIYSFSYYRIRYNFSVDLCYFLTIFIIVFLTSLSFVVKLSSHLSKTSILNLLYIFSLFTHFVELL